MGLKIGTWNVAYRIKNDKCLYEDTERPFKIIKNGHFGWAADPFLFEYKKDVYLFVEFFSYKNSKGYIAYSKFNKTKNKFEKYKKIISEDFHMSYPLVFEHNNNIYMMPETSASNSLFLYKAIDFPEKWERTSLLMENIKLTDTTPISIENNYYALTYKIDGTEEENGELLILEFKNHQANILSKKAISKDVSLARPGGHFIKKEDRIIRVSQDCVGEYGRALNFLEITGSFIDNYSEKLIKKIEPNQIKTNCVRKSCGIHTYNSTSQFEVIDLKYYKRSYIRAFYKILKELR